MEVLDYKNEFIDKKQENHLQLQEKVLQRILNFLITLMCLLELTIKEKLWKTFQKEESKI